MRKSHTYVLLFALLGLFGTASAARADGVVIEIGRPPVVIEHYPRAWYGGRYAYYYDNHWYYRRGPHWVYYREEPRPLYEYRNGPRWHEHVHRAPPAHERWHHHPASSSACSPPRAS